MGAELHPIPTIIAPARRPRRIVIANLVIAAINDMRLLTNRAWRSAAGVAR